MKASDKEFVEIYDQLKRCPIYGFTDATDCPHATRNVTKNPATRKKIRCINERSKLMEENYQVPQELVDLWEESIAAEEARDSAVKGFFKFQVRNAIYLGVMARAKKKEFWKSLRDLYPDLGTHIEYDYIAKTVSNIENKAD